MAKAGKVIITCAVTGAIHTPSMSPHLPVTPDEIAAAAIGAAEAGAAIIHLHARDPETGKPDQTPEAFQRFLPRIKQQSDCVINLTTGGAPWMRQQVIIDLAAAQQHASDAGRLLRPFRVVEHGPEPARGEIRERRRGRGQPQQALGCHHDQRPQLGVLRLPPQEMEVLRGRRAVDDADVALGAQRQVALEARAQFRGERLAASRAEHDRRADLLLACISRAIDDREIALQKQSRVFFQISGAGHEALLLGLARHLRPGYDWFFPYYRDRALCLALGMTPREMFLASVGSKDDPANSGRQMPSHWGHRALNIPSQSSCTGTQCLHAVGSGDARRIYERGEQIPDRDKLFHPDEITYVSIGDGGTSEGEFWESLSIACSRKLPVLFMVEDNGYAISVPVEVQTPGGDISRIVEGFVGLRQVRDEEVVLAREVPVERGARDLRLCDDAIDAHGVQAFRVEELGGRVEESSTRLRHPSPVREPSLMSARLADRTIGLDIPSWTPQAQVYRSFYLPDGWDVVHRSTPEGINPMSGSAAEARVDDSGPAPAGTTGTRTLRTLYLVRFGFAVAWAAREAGVPARIVKHVSDNADETALDWANVVDRSARDLAAWLSVNV